MSKLPDESALLIRRQLRQNQPSCSESCRQFCCFWVLWHSPVIILNWNEIVNKGTRIPLAVPWKITSECPSSKVGWVVNSELKHSFSRDIYRKASTLRDFAAVFICQPTAREVKALLETSSPEKCLQWALDLWPLAWLYSQLDLLQFNSVLLPYILGLKEHKTVICSLSLPSISRFLSLSFSSSAVLPLEEWNQTVSGAGALFAGLWA